MIPTPQRCVIIGMFVLVLTIGGFVIWPNYQSARIANAKAEELEMRVEQLQLRQVEVEQLRSDLIKIEERVKMDCKHVPNISGMASIVQALSIDVDGIHVLDQTFTAGNMSHVLSEEDTFSVHPLAISMLADFDSIIFVLYAAESMNRLLQISSIRITRSDTDADIAITSLDAAIGLHAMYDKEAP